MKKMNHLLIIGIVILSLHGNAESETIKTMTFQQKQQVALAIKLLIDSQILKGDPTKECLNFDGDILRILELEGHLEKGQTTPQTICFGGDR